MGAFLLILLLVQLEKGVPRVKSRGSYFPLGWGFVLLKFFGFSESSAYFGLLLRFRESNS